MTATTTRAIIPARLEASRFPRKLLAIWRERTVLEWVWRATRACDSFSSVTIATGDEEIGRVAQGFGADVHLDRRPYRNGTERAAGACQGVHGDVVVVQADQPGLQSAHLSCVVNAMKQLDADMWTPCVPLDERRQSDLDVVKCWTDSATNNARFARTMPHEARTTRIWRHIGIYAYRQAAIERYAAAGCCEAEKVQRLEQLRSLELGQRVRLVPLPTAAPCVDRPEDIDRLNDWFSRSAP